MDILRIESKTMLTFISMALSKVIKSKFKTANVDIGRMEAKVDEKGMVNFSLNLSGELSVEDLINLL